MWLISEEGFASVVAHREKEGVLLVRGRAREDLEAFCRVAADSGIGGFDPEGIWEDPTADYRWRMEVDQAAVARLASVLVERIRYDNFKSRVAESDPGRARVYTEVWGALLRVSDQREG